KEPRTESEVKATLTYLDAKPGERKTEEVVFAAIPGSPGRYRLFRKHDQTGRVEVKIEGMEGSERYEVNLPTGHEREELPMAAELLGKAARLSGGGFYREEDLHRLSGDVEEKKTSFIHHHSILLWNPLVFLLFIGLITTEWVLRKFSNLS